MLYTPSDGQVKSDSDFSKMTVAPHVFHATKCTCSDVNWCSYSKWSAFFPGFLPKAKVLKPVPQAFLDYLNSESIRIPAPKYDDKVVSTSENEYSDWENESDDETSDPVASFKDFHNDLDKVVSKWKSVMVKLNWSAPKDAKWILINNSLQCTSVQDIYLLLNASDHAAHDLDGHIYDECEDKDTGERAEPELVVKKWITDFNPALEFRIFVRDKMIVGVSQRDLNHYEFLENLQLELKKTISDFHANVLKSSEFPLSDYIMDVYIPRPYNKVTILDINPFDRKWNSLLFTWHELLERLEGTNFELRIITETNLGSMARKDHSENQVPIEVVDASLNSEAMIELAKKWHLLGVEDNDNE